MLRMKVYSILSVILFGITVTYCNGDVSLSRKELLTELEPMKQEIRDQKKELQNQKEVINLQGDLINQMKETIALLTKDVSVSQVVSEYYTAMGCLSEDITLSCTAGGIINLNNAIYGQYNTTCSTCCPPNPSFDCVEDVEENRPSDWLAIVALCQNQTSCDYEYQGSVVDTCQEDYYADYMQIFYSCSSGSSNQSVGFTAYSNTSPVDYLIGEIIFFDSVVDNIGGSYNVKTASFLCPVNGVYVFSVSFVSFNSYNMYLEIMMDKIQLVEGWADNISGHYSSASNLVVTQCFAGQTVWTRAGDTVSIYNAARRSTFSGYLLNRT